MRTITSKFATTLVYILLVFIAAGNVVAKTPSISAKFDKSAISVEKEHDTEFNVFIDSANEKVSAAMVRISYPKRLLEFKNDNVSKPNTECIGSHKINQTISVKNDTSKGIVEVTKLSIAPTEQLPSGKICLGTFRFKAKDSFWYFIPWFRNGNVSFSDTKEWQIVGPNGTFEVNSNTNQASLQITVTN
jgi:hypothetical protein